jgi:hypothetical protein
MIRFTDCPYCEVLAQAITAEPQLEAALRPVLVWHQTWCRNRPRGQG